MKVTPTIFPEAGPTTTNVRWGIEATLLRQGVFPTAPLIIALEKYFIETVQHSDLACAGRSSVDEELEFGALENNIQFEGDE